MLKELKRCSQIGIYCHKILLMIWHDEKWLLVLIALCMKRGCTLFSPTWHSKKYRISEINIASAVINQFIVWCKGQEYYGNVTDNVAASLIKRQLCKPFESLTDHGWTKIIYKEQTKEARKQTYWKQSIILKTNLDFTRPRYRYLFSNDL